MRLLGERRGGLHALRLARQGGQEHGRVIGQPADAQHKGPCETRTILVLFVPGTKGTPERGGGAGNDLLSLAPPIQGWFHERRSMARAAGGAWPRRRQVWRMER